MLASEQCLTLDGVENDTAIKEESTHLIRVMEND